MADEHERMEALLADEPHKRARSTSPKPPGGSDVSSGGDSDSDFPSPSKKPRSDSYVFVGNNELDGEEVKSDIDETETETASSQMREIEDEIKERARRTLPLPRPSPPQAQRIPRLILSTEFLRAHTQARQRQQQQQQQQRFSAGGGDDSESEEKKKKERRPRPATEEAQEISEEQAESEEPEAEAGFYEAYPHLKPKSKSKPKRAARGRGRGKSRGRGSRGGGGGGDPSGINWSQLADSVLGAGGGGLPPAAAADPALAAGLADIPLPPKHVPTRTSIDFKAWDEEDFKKVENENPIALRAQVGAAPYNDPKSYTCDRTWCFYCLCTNHVIDATSEATNVQALWNRASEGWHKNDRLTLMRDIQKMYNDNLRWFLADPAYQRPWMLSTIFLHFTVHDQSGIFQMEEDLSNLNAAIGIQGGSRLILEDPTTSEKSIDVSGFRVFSGMLQARSRLLNEMRNFRANSTA